MRGSVADAGVYGLQHRPGVVGGPLVGVVARLAALVEEGPVARLGRQQLARGAAARRRRAGRAESARSSRSSSRRAPQARSATAGESQVREVLVLAPGGGGSWRSTGSCSASACGTVTVRTPAASAPSSTARSQIGPSDHQWPSSSVSIAKTSRPRRSLRGGVARAGGRRSRRGTRSPGAAPRPRPRPGRRRRRPPSRAAPRAAICRRTGRGRGRRDSRRATRASRSPPSRSAAPPGRPRSRTGASASQRRLVGALVDAEPAHPRLGQAPLEARRVGALGQPEAAVPAEAAPVRADARRRAAAAVPARVASSGSTAWVAAEVASATRPSAAARWNGRQRVAAGRVEQLQRPPVAGQLRLAGGPALGRHLRQVGFGGADPPLDQELPQPLAAPRRPRAGRPAPASRSSSAVSRHLQHRQVGADHRVEQPLLAERDRSRTPPRRACGSAGRSPGRRPSRGLSRSRQA